jgi:cation:H+ antiporter
MIRGASQIAARFGLSEIVIGLTLLSVGTSLPELLVNIMANLNGSADLAIGNVLGSNIANVLLVLGCAAIVRPLPIRDATLFSEIPFSLSAAFLVGFLANAHLLGAQTGLMISRVDGLILIGFFLLFLVYIFQVWGDQHQAVTEVIEHEGSLAKSLFWVLCGSIGLAIGASWVVDGALAISAFFDVSESFVGLTIVAIGTSLPELVTCVIAARRGNTDLAVGNVIGSNIFNLLWVLGLGAIICPMPFDQVSNIDITMIVASSALLLLAVAIGRKYLVDRKEGTAFVISYLIYVSFLVDRG